MARTYEELTTALNACIEAGEIYNVDFQDWKTYGASRALEKEIKAAKTAHYYGVDHDDLVTELAWAAMNVSIVTFPSKKLAKAIAEAPDCEFVRAIGDIVDRWTPIADKFRALKPMIVKGRKPSTTPRKTKERTIENTGTCGCCGKNVKMDGGKLVSHGFTIRHGYQEGRCYGVGCDPVEVSPEGIVRYAEAMAARMNSASVRLVKLAAATHKIEADKTKAHNSAVYSTERDYRWAKEAMEFAIKRIEEWKPSALPGA